jgi:hypothetical protein
VVLGTAISNGPTPTIEEAYDPKSLEHIKAGTYPVEIDMVNEMEAFNAVFQKYDVKVFRPQIIDNYNQIFARDIGFVIDDIFIKANILRYIKKEPIQIHENKCMDFFYMEDLISVVKYYIGEKEAVAIALVPNIFPSWVLWVRGLLLHLQNKQSYLRIE